MKADAEQAEICPGAMTMVEEIAVRIREQNGAALVVDYGGEGSSKHTFRVRINIDKYRFYNFIIFSVRGLDPTRFVMR